MTRTPISVLAGPPQRIIPATRKNQVGQVTKQADGSLALVFKDGRTGTLPANEPDMQAFVIWTMLNSECRR